MKSDEYGAEQNPECAGQRREGEAQAHARADESDRDRKEMKVSQEPEGSLVDDASVALMLGNVVDRLVFDAHTVSADLAVARSASQREPRGLIVGVHRQIITARMVKSVNLL